MDRIADVIMSMANTPNIDETHCPGCGRFVGPYDTCPHCQSSLRHRISLKVFRWIAVGGSIIGLIILWIGLRIQEVPLLHAGQIDLQHNMATARFEGKVISVSTDDKKNSFRITLDDGTGLIMLMGHGKLSVFRKVLGDTFPRPGDTISAVGNISYSENYGLTAFIASPRRLTMLSRDEVIRKELGRITREDIGLIGRFDGTVVEVTPFAKGMTLRLQDPSGQQQLTVFHSELKRLEDTRIDQISKIGTTVRFLGRVDVYRNEIQLRLVEPADPGNLDVQPPAEPVSAPPVS